MKDLAKLYSRELVQKMFEKQFPFFDITEISEPDWETRPYMDNANMCFVKVSTKLKCNSKIKNTYELVLRYDHRWDLLLQIFGTKGSNGGFIRDFEDWVYEETGTTMHDWPDKQDGEMVVLDGKEHHEFEMLFYEWYMNQENAHCQKWLGVEPEAVNEKENWFCEHKED